MYDNMILMESDFFIKRETKRNKIQENVSIMENVYKEKADNLEAQYKRVLKIKEKTAYINIHGPLSQDGPDWIDVYFGWGGTAYLNIIRAAEEVRELYDKGDIENVIIRMNTPGGEVDGIDHAYQALKKINDIGIVKNDGMVASGGVWLAMAFDRIEPSTDSARIGSIGIVIEYADYTGYYDSFGIKIITITNTDSPDKRPDFKTEKGQNIVREYLDDLYKVFVSKITAVRPITEKQINSIKGRMLISSKAIEIGLMDTPLIEDNSKDADFGKNNKESEVSKLETEVKKPDVVTENVITEEMLTNAIQIERARIYGLAKISGVEISAELKTAIDTGVELGKYAVEQVEAKEAKEKAEIEAAKKLRDDNKDQEISGINSGDNIATNEDDVEAKKVDDVVDAQIKKQKGSRK